MFQGLTFFGIKFTTWLRICEIWTIGIVLTVAILVYFMMKKKKKPEKKNPYEHSSSVIGLKD